MILDSATTITIFTYLVLGLVGRLMLDTGIDLVIAFPGGTGTADMVRRARKAGVEVREIAVESPT